ncbi:hypothetical protein B0A55_11157 [Friedmanniomyces simplex]|uniref:Uncharacterized protein n=1 Tax=Friedmanniomyces simplex TaxID=329884 RepID=A0A4U0WA83_9PEZI|nr:hypothetical protein B0A55_11157 [Friedmanniomyces simplex]
MDHTQADMFDMNAKKEDDSIADSALKGIETDIVLAQKGLTDGDLEGKLQEPILDDDLTKQSDIERNNRPSKHARTAPDRSDTPRRLE